MNDRGRLGVVWDPRFTDYDFGPGHPFTEKSRELALQLASIAGSWRSASSPVQWFEKIECASDAEIRLFHEEEYLDLVRNLSRRSGGEPLDQGDTPSFLGCYEASARLAAGALAAMRAMDRGETPRSFHPAGGLHHAAPGRASGFCIFNDLAIAIRWAMDRSHRLRRVAYIDIDAHHGDGVMYGFYEEGRVLDLDFHQDGRTLFPGTGSLAETGSGDGSGLKVNVPLPPGAGDDALVPVFTAVAPTLLRSFRPDVIVLQHGMDGHAGDRLASLQYTAVGYTHVLTQVATLADELCGGRLLVSGGGGYDATNVARGLARAGLQLAGQTTLSEPPGDLPTEWRLQFRARLGTEAARDWKELVPLHRSPWGPQHTDRLLTELSNRLGRKFTDG